MSGGGPAGMRAAGLLAARQLAHDFGVAEDLVVHAYEREVARMVGDAAVRHYLDLLAIKHVRAQLAARRRVATPHR